MQFTEFIGAPSLPPIDVTEELCTRFRDYLLANFTGDTPMNYWSRFKKVIKAAYKQRYFIDNPVDDVKGKVNPSKSIKENMEIEDYISLLGTHCKNQHIADAFIFSMYTGLRWCDVKKLQDVAITNDIMIKRLVQSKTGKPMSVTLHPIALKVVQKVHRERLATGNISPLLFELPTRNGTNKVIKGWINDVNISKKITWSGPIELFDIIA
ncbi:integrase [Chitinophagaceae bacterium OAS944]|nr:integrase [Chitinophagaceae bacterium OAS944]